MNRIRCTTATKKDDEWFRGKTLNLSKCKVNLIRKSKSRRQQNHGIKNDENLERKKKSPECHFDELSLPKLKRVKSVYEKQRLKSKFDMLNAEKFVRIFDNAVNSRKTPHDVRKCVQERKKFMDKKKKTKKIKAKDILRKLTSCNGKRFFLNYNFMTHAFLQMSFRKALACNVMMRNQQIKENA